MIHHQFIYVVRFCVRGGSRIMDGLHILRVWYGNVPCPPLPSPPPRPPYDPTSFRRGQVSQGQREDCRVYRAEIHPRANEFVDSGAESRPCRACNHLARPYGSICTRYGARFVFPFYSHMQRYLPLYSSSHTTQRTSYIYILSPTFYPASYSFTSTIRHSDGPRGGPSPSPPLPLPPPAPPSLPLLGDDLPFPQSPTTRRS